MALISATARTMALYRQATEDELLRAHVLELLKKDAMPKKQAAQEAEKNESMLDEIIDNIVKMWLLAAIKNNGRKSKTIQRL